MNPNIIEKIVKDLTEEELIELLIDGETLFIEDEIIDWLCTNRPRVVTRYLTATNSPEELPKSLLEKPEFPHGEFDNGLHWKENT